MHGSLADAQAPARQKAHRSAVSEQGRERLSAWRVSGTQQVTCRCLNARNRHRRCAGRAAPGPNR
jgi:hypothetical protein